MCADLAVLPTSNPKPSPWTDEALAALAAAVFAKPGVWVAEAYSQFDAAPCEFTSAADLAKHMRDELAGPNGMVFVFVVYADMDGRATLETIHLQPGAVPGHELRHTWKGWGLISIQLTHGGPGDMRSRVVANSEQRARQWQATYPQPPTPDSWNWQAVASHTRRLRRVLRKLAP